MFPKINKRMFLALAVLTIGVWHVSTTAVVAQSEPESEKWKIIRNSIDKQEACWNEGNIDGFMQTYWNSPDLTFSGGGQTTRGWQATLERYKSRYPDRETMGQLRFDNLEFQSLGDEAALVLGNWHLTTANGNPHGNFSLVFRKIDGQWLIVHDHSSTNESDK